MATITLHYDAKSPTAKKALDFLLTLGVFKAEESQQKTAELDLAIKDVEAGRINTYKNSDELFQKLRQCNNLGRKFMNCLNEN